VVEQFAFNGIIGIKEISFERNLLKDFRFVAISEMVNLNKLVLTKNSIENVVFTDFNFTPNLEKLSLNQNLIVKLQAYSFSKLAKLTLLDLSENKIELIDIDCFNGLKSLQILLLDKNKIKYLTIQNFNLVILNSKLTSNQTIPIEKSYFAGLFNLFEISVGYNQMSSMQFILIPEMANLKRLVLTNNSINEVNRECFDFSNDIETLLINKNRISKLEAFTFFKAGKLDLFGFVRERDLKFSSELLFRIE
jgi:Leucine-rich repeat (LRR) protein